MKAWLHVAMAIAQAWAAAYTFGLRRDVGTERRAELESDLWEHIRASDDDGRSPSLTAAEVVLRLAIGVPADVMWRIRDAPERQTVLALAGGSTLRMPARRAQNSWFGRNGWVVPLAIVLGVLVFMWWLMDSTRLSRLSLEITAPEHIAVSDPSWELRAECCSRGSAPVWETRHYVHTLGVTNHAAHEARLRIEGLDRLPRGFTHEYGVARAGSTDAHRALQGLQAAYSHRLTGARDFPAATSAFEANELRAFVDAYSAFFEAEPRDMGELWLMGETWLAHLPETPVCASEGRPTGCIDYITVPPGATVDVAVVIELPRGSEEGHIRDIELALVDLASP